MDGVGLGIVILDEDHGVRAGAVVIFGGHLEIIAALHLHEEFAGFLTVFFFRKIAVIAEGGCGVEGIALGGGHILPLNAVNIGRAVGLLLVVWNDQLDVRVFGHAEIGAVFAEEMDGEVLADVDIAAILRALGAAARIIIEHFRGGDDAVDEILTRGKGRMNICF